MELRMPAVNEFPKGAPFPGELTPLCDMGDAWMSAWNHPLLAKSADERLGPLKDCVYDDGGRVCRRCGEENYLLRNAEIEVERNAVDGILALMYWHAYNGRPFQLPPLTVSEKQWLTAAIIIEERRRGRRPLYD